MIEFVYSEEKERWLNENRNISFRSVIAKLEGGEVKAIIPNPNQKKYAGQEAFVIEIEGYKCLVPFIEDEDKVFLKTIYRDRKINKRYKND